LRLTIVRLRDAPTVTPLRDAPPPPFLGGGGDRRHISSPATRGRWCDAN